MIRTLEKEKKDNTEQNVIEAKELWFRYEKNAPDILRSMDFQLKKRRNIYTAGRQWSRKKYFSEVGCRIITSAEGKSKDFRRHAARHAASESPGIFHYDTVWEEFLESAVAGWKEEAARQKAEEMGSFSGTGWKEVFSSL